MITEEVIILENSFFASMRYVGQKKFSTTSNIPNMYDGLKVGDEILVIVEKIIKYSEEKKNE